MNWLNRYADPVYCVVRLTEIDIVIMKRVLSVLAFVFVAQSVHPQEVKDFGRERLNNSRQLANQQQASNAPTSFAKSN